MNRYFYLLLVIFTTLISCGHKNQILYIQFNQASDLRAETKVMRNGFPIGEITGLAFADSTILATVVLIDSVRIPKYSRFVLESADLSVGKQVSVYPHQSEKVYIQSGDTVMGQVSEQEGTLTASDLASAMDTTVLKNSKHKVNGIVDSVITKKRNPGK